jgi:hypothetical protein
MITRDCSYTLKTYYIVVVIEKICWHFFIFYQFFFIFFSSIFLFDFESLSNCFLAECPITWNIDITAINDNQRLQLYFKNLLNCDSHRENLLAIKLNSFELRQSFSLFTEKTNRKSDCDTSFLLFQRDSSQISKPWFSYCP